MRITPLDVRNHQFSRRLRGIDPEEVETFLRLVSEDYEQLVRENEGQGEETDEEFRGLLDADDDGGASLSDDEGVTGGPGGGNRGGMMMPPHQPGGTSLPRHVADGEQMLYSTVYYR